MVWLSFVAAILQIIAAVMLWQTGDRITATFFWLVMVFQVWYVATWKNRV